ncbi:uncharacterized protein LOC114516369 isoform X2 [Dendronephthya gigantea]|uniref:uncharacterized protein LOC114516369 isoform X2 n=1 Tax=Dendronephthya gigantea TaxID=151771 RepID=UPI00106BD75B|nr:uncharacterized protein LOC114516369 isoform X2 [Dendronephthya gigantea]
MMVMAEKSQKRKNEAVMNVEDMEVDEVAENDLLTGKVTTTVIKKLEQEYGTDWKQESHASKVHMIPCIFTPKRNTRDSTSGREAERTLYNTLENINNRGRAAEHFRGKMHGFVFHDRIFNHEEIDFIFVTIHGLVIFECKAVKRESRAKNEFLKARDQLERKVSVLDFIPSGLPTFKVVAFPLLARCDIVIENKDDTRILFKEGLVDIKDWLRRTGIVKQKIPFSDYTLMVTAILLKYHQSDGTTFNNAREFKRRAICGSDSNLTKETKCYTKEQANLLKSRDLNSEDVWITGAAGTGKTFVLKDRVKLLADKYPEDDDDKKILVITYNCPVNKEIERWVETNAKNKGKSVRVQTFCTLLHHIFKAVKGDKEEWEKFEDMKKRNDDGVEEDMISYIIDQQIIKKYFGSHFTYTRHKFHHILVDEAQDLPGNWLGLLDSMLNKREKSSIWIFEDPFQVVRRNTARPRNYEINQRFTRHSLTKVVRNTHNVYEAYSHCYDDLREKVTSATADFSNEELSPPTVNHSVYGKSPEYIPGESVDQLNNLLITTIKELQEQGVPLFDMAIITCGTEVNRVVTLLQDESIKSVNSEKWCELKYSKNGKNDPPVTVDSYQRFKGLEARVLIFFIPKGWTPRDMDIYVGFSRSFCHLVVIGTSQVIQKIRYDDRKID